MPIRRAPATATQEKGPAAAAAAAAPPEKEPEASSEESPSADEELAAPSAAPAEGENATKMQPTENGEEGPDDGAAPAAASEDKEKGGEEEEEENGAEKKDCQTDEPTHEPPVTEESTRLKDGYKYEKSKVKKVKRTIPAWATIASGKKVPVTNYAGTQNKVDNILIEAITSCSDRSGVSYQFVMKYILKKYPLMDEKKFLIKKAMKKHLEKGTIKQLKGKGLTGKFTIGKQNPSSKKGNQNKETLGDALPLIITRLCEPKEASYIMIKKYLEQHFPNLNIENRPDILKSALVKAVDKGQLEQITGKGANGTFQLRRIGSKGQQKGTPVEDAITTAITAMNEPKTCSTTTLRKYLVEANKDGREALLVANLRRTLTRCKVLGWMEQITGHGFTGTYQLSFPYYPSPTILYPEKYKEPEKKPNPPSTRRRRHISSDEESEEESEEEEEEEESDDEDEDDESEGEAIPQKRSTKKRPPPKARGPPPQKKSRSTSTTKAKGKGRQVAKKSPPKKSPAKKVAPPPPAKTPVKKPAPKKASPSKATPTKKRAPAKKAKTPSKKAPKQPVDEESSSDEAPVAKTPRGGSKRSKVEEPPAAEPPAKKPATKGAARRSVTKASPAKASPVKASPVKASPVKASPAAKPAPKRGAKGGKATARKSKRGRN